MTQEYAAKYHDHVYFDNFLTSVELMKLHIEQNFYACGTAHLGRKD
jgi:hypothetical protein